MQIGQRHLISDVKALELPFGGAAEIQVCFYVYLRENPADAWSACGARNLISADNRPVSKLCFAGSSTAMNRTNSND